MAEKINPINAVMQDNPYHYYRYLANEKAFYYDEELKLWVASSLDMIDLVLSDPRLVVRPMAEPVPLNIKDSTAGLIFSHLVRMNEGQSHCPFKRLIQEKLWHLDEAKIQELSVVYLKQLIESGGLENLNELVFHLPIYVVAGVLGVPSKDLEQLSLWMADFVRCLSPLSQPQQIEQSKLAAQQLWHYFSELPTRLFLMDIPNEKVAIANTIGLLSQSYEATAGLISNSLYFWAKHPKWSAKDIVEQVTYYDPPIQNTRRFVAENLNLAGHQLQQGETILVLLAAANYQDGITKAAMTFGYGRHQCPGQQMAFLIAIKALEYLQIQRIDQQQLLKPRKFYLSANARITLF